MITFQIVLTTMQVATLQAIQQQNDFLIARGLKPGQFRKLKSKLGTDAENEYFDLARNVSTYFITSSRALQREGLIRWSSEAGHVITDKGRLTLQVIEMDIDEMKSQLKDIKKLCPVPRRKIA